MGLAVVDAGDGSLIRMGLSVVLVGVADVTGEAPCSDFNTTMFCPWRKGCP